MTETIMAQVRAMFAHLHALIYAVLECMQLQNRHTPLGECNSGLDHPLTPMFNAAVPEVPTTTAYCYGPRAESTYTTPIHHSGDLSAYMSSGADYRRARSERKPKLLSPSRDEFAA